MRIFDISSTFTDFSNVGLLYIYKRDPKFIISVRAEVPAPNDVSLLADTVLITQI